MSIHYPDCHLDGCPRAGTLTAADADVLADVLAGLTDEWHEWETADGATVEIRLRVLPDPHTEVNDYDCYGRTEWDSRHTNAYGYRMRPDGMDGNAEVIRHDTHLRLWWQPPADGPARDSDGFRELRDTVRDLTEYGFVGYVVDVRADVPTDYGTRTVDVTDASLWAIDERDPRQCLDVVRDLIAECFEITD